MPSPRLAQVLLTYAEVADQLGVSVARVRQLVAAREFDVIDGGHRTKRVPQSSLDAYIARRTVPARTTGRRQSA